MSAPLNILVSLGGGNLAYTAWFVSWDSAIGVVSSASITLGSNGVVSETGAAADNSSPGANWFSPTQTGIGSQYWVRATVTVGASTDTGTFGSWLSLSAGQSWGQNSATSTKSTTFTLEFATDAAGANIVKTVTGTVVARTHS